MRARTSFLSLIGALSLLATAACGDDDGDGGGDAADKGSVTVASAGFTESRVMAQMYAALLEKAGYDTSVTDVQASEIFQSSLESGDVDVVPAYVATYADQLNLLENGKNADPVSSPSLEDSLAALEELAEARGLAVLEPTDAVDQNAFAVSQEFAAEHDLETLSDLGDSGLTVTIAAGAECKTRPFCQPGLEKTYGIKIDGIDPLGVDTVQTKRSVQRGKNELALVLTTDATLPDFGLVALEDDKNLQNADNLVPIVNAATLEEQPDIEAELNKLADVLTTEDLAEMNKQVDVERGQPEQVARDYLTDKGLL